MYGQVVDVLINAFVGRPADFANRTTAERLHELGWVAAESNSAGGWRKWTLGSVVAYETEWVHGRGVEVLLKFSPPAEADDREALYDNFERIYRETVAVMSEAYGAPTVESEFDEPPLPVPGQFDCGALWELGPWNLMASLQQEDKEAPLRISLWVFQES